MQLEKKVVVIHGAAGAVGSTIARAFAREGARVMLTSHRGGAKLEALARELAGAEAAVVDALDEKAVEAHLDEVVRTHGGVDIAFNAIGISQEGLQGVPLASLDLGAFMRPIETYARAHFITARAAARRMVARGSGVIFAHTPEPARTGGPMLGGMALAWASVEQLMRSLSWELATRGVRAVALRTTGLPETATIDQVFGIHARALGVEAKQFRAMIEGRAHHQRSTTLAELADAAVFVASERGRGFTGTTLNLTGGISLD